MKKTVLIAALLALTVTSAFATGPKTPDTDPPPREDTWTGADKFLHFGGGALIAGAVTAATESRAWGFGAGCAVGLAKEAIDKVASGKDAVVTCLGAALGAYAAGWVIERRGRETVVSYRWEF